MFDNARSVKQVFNNFTNIQLHITFKLTLPRDCFCTKSLLEVFDTVYRYQSIGKTA